MSCWNINLFRFYLLWAILTVEVWEIECRVKPRIESYGKVYSKNILDLDSLLKPKPEQVNLVRNCSLLSWSDENCILGPVSLKNVPSSLFKQICPEPFGKFYISCKHYAVCYNDSLTVNHCPTNSTINLSTNLCKEADDTPCSLPATGSSGMSFIKSLANQKASLTLLPPTLHGQRSESFVFPPSLLPVVGLETRENEKKYYDLVREDKSHDKDASQTLNPVRVPLPLPSSNASSFQTFLGHDDDDDNIKARSQTSFTRYLEGKEVILCTNLTNGIYRHPDSCGHFIQCIFGKDHVQECAPGTFFNPATSFCDWETNVPSCIPSKRTIINLNDNRVRRSVMNHYNVISDTNSMTEPKKLSKHEMIPSRVKRNIVPTSSTLRKAQRKCSWGENYIQPHSQHCNKFEICSNGRIVEQTCGLGTLFNPLSTVCDQPYNVDCTSRKVDFSTYDCQKTFEKYKTAHPENCSKFVECDRGNLHIKNCPPGTTYSVENEICDYSFKVECKKPISLENDMDVNYIPRPKRANSLNLACEYNYIAIHPKICNKFVECENKRLFIKSCGPGTVFNPELGQCDWAYNTRIPNEEDCGSYFQCERGEYRVKRCLGNTIYHPSTKKCIFSHRGRSDCQKAVIVPRPEQSF